MKALKNPLVSRASHGNPLRAADASGPAGAGAGVIVDVTGGGDGGGVAAAAGPVSLNSANCESGCQLVMPSRQPRSPGTKRPERSPSRTSSSEKTPSVL